MATPRHFTWNLAATLLACALAGCGSTAAPGLPGATDSGPTSDGGTVTDGGSPGSDTGAGAADTGTDSSGAGSDSGMQGTDSGGAGSDSGMQGTDSGGAGSDATVDVGVGTDIGAAMDGGDVDADAMDGGPMDSESPCTATSCGAGLVCCPGTGRCYDSRCLACCMPRADAGTLRCTDNSTCAATAYCAGSGCGTLGVCEPRPFVCPALYNPVCGCDGRTYGNDCEAQRGGTRVARIGVCATVLDAGSPDVGTGGCTSSADCPAGDYCTGVGCGTPGLCAVRPRFCPLIVLPVCGCDGVTYTNACFAERVGVRVERGGRCLATVDGGTADAGVACGPTTCGAGSACCAATGRCYDIRCLACCRAVP